LSVVAKASRVIEAFLDARSVSLPFHQIRDAAELSPATAHRLLSDLVENGWLTQREDRTHYALGPLLLSVGVVAAEGLTHRRIAQPHIERLRDDCGETVVVAELHDGLVVPVLRADGLFEMRMNQQLGARYPAYAGATGKLLLANLAPDELDGYLRSSPLEPLTARTTTDEKHLRHELELIRRFGLSVSRGERVTDAVAISAPLRDRRGVTVAAVTLSGVASRLGPGELVPAVRSTLACAAAISHELGWTAAGETEDGDEDELGAYCAAAVADDARVGAA
jgi:DNA-binding IclR family transcriptional regulator